MQVCSMRHRSKCHQDLMDALHRVAVSLIVFTVQRYWIGVPNIVKGIKKFGKIVFMTPHTIYYIVRSNPNSLTDGFRQQKAYKEYAHDGLAAPLGLPIVT